MYREILIGIGVVIGIAIIKMILPYIGKFFKFLFKKIITFFVNVIVNFRVHRAEKKYKGEKLGAIKKEYVLKKTAFLTRFENVLNETIDNIIEKFVAQLNNTQAVRAEKLKSNISELAEDKIYKIGNSIKNKINNKGE